jgi:hypothetical protein
MEADDVMEKGNEVGSGPRPHVATQGGGGSGGVGKAVGARRCGSVQFWRRLAVSGGWRQSGMGQKRGHVGRSREEGKWVGPRAQ